MNRYQLTLSVLLALLGTLLLALYVRRVEHELSGGARAPVLVARTNLARGTVLGREMLTLREVPSAYLERRAVRASELEHALGLGLEVALQAGDGLLWSDVDLGLGRDEVSEMVAVGKQAYSVPLAGTGATRLIRPGDFVDVYAGRALLLQKVLVLAVGASTERDGAPVADANVLTFSLEPTQIRQLKEHEPVGISVTIRNPEDSIVALDWPPRASPARPEPASHRPEPVWQHPPR